MSEPLRVALFHEDGITRVEPIADGSVEPFTVSESVETVLEVPIKILVLPDERHSPDASAIGNGE